MGKLLRSELGRLIEGDCVGNDSVYWRLIVPKYTWYPTMSDSGFALQLSVYVSWASADEIPPKTKATITIAKAQARTVLFLRSTFSSQHASPSE